MSDLLVAGEPSGDRALAGVARALGLGQLGRGGRRAFGFGGDALAAEGVELIAHVRELGGMGVVEAAARAPSIALALARLSAHIARERPRLAVLASWSTMNARLAAVLHRAGVIVAWISPPEIWAWRAGRAPAIARSVDLLVPTLPFEEALWRSARGNARYVGHPVLDVPREERPRLRARWSLPERGPLLAVLPGSRPSEIERLLAPFVEAARAAAIDARVLVAPSLDARSREAIARSGVPALDAPDGAAPLLPAFDVALVASGTAALEAAAMGVPPVIAYAMHPVSFAIARRVVDTRKVGLPNVLLARAGQAPAFEELLQDDVTPGALAAALARTFADPGARDACRAVRAILEPVGDAPGGDSFAARAASLVARLGGRASR
ncbi:MAG: lipid-A-disaccharide synthase [Deltaproteobacteria bacterium]|nr:lipid-A-disaccharide synthase [Deltaproteobacteria bacterium]